MAAVKGMYLSREYCPECDNQLYQAKDKAKWWCKECNSYWGKQDLFAKPARKTGRR
jgi:ribosomal protein L37AE/L43A